MKTITVDVKHLLNILYTNRQKHVGEYEEAIVEYRKEMIRQMEENLAEAKAGGQIKGIITLPVPISYKNSYDTAIEMLELGLDTSVELDEQEFKTYVKDQWNWKDSFLATTANYKKGF